jgi:hypothetical protein
MEVGCMTTGVNTKPTRIVGKNKPTIQRLNEV